MLLADAIIRGCLIADNVAVGFIGCVNWSLKFFLFLIKDWSQLIEYLFYALFLLLYLPTHFFELVFIWVYDIPNWVHLFCDLFLAFLQISFYCFNCFSCCEHFMFSMASMYGALWTNRSITVKTKIGKLFFWMGLAHVKVLLSFRHHNIVIRISRVCRLRYWNVRMLLISLTCWGRLIYILGLFELDFICFLPSTCLIRSLVFITLSYGTLSSSIIKSFFALNSHNYYF